MSRPLNRYEPDEDTDMATDLSLSHPEAVLIRQALQNLITLNESTLDALRRMSHRQASFREAEADVAVKRIAMCRSMLARLKDEP
jgi:hypothetical protein